MVNLAFAGNLLRVTSCGWSTRNLARGIVPLTPRLSESRGLGPSSRWSLVGRSVGIEQQSKPVAQLFFGPGHENRADLANTSAEHAAETEQGTAAAHHADVAGAVADDLAVRTQHRV
jgi:hypothetical protein